jgi:hypothetical protein
VQSASESDNTPFVYRVDLVGSDETPAERTMFADRAELVGEATKPEKVERVSPQPTAAGLPKRAPAPSPVPAAATPADGWGPADGGWSAASNVLKSTVDDTTSAGLPKRTPKARLMPGSLSAPSPRATAPAPTNGNGAVPSATATAVVTAPSRRSADRLRQRFATYQRGVQMGRESAEDNGLPWEGLSFDNADNKEQK